MKTPRGGTKKGGDAAVAVAPAAIPTLAELPKTLDEAAARHGPPSERTRARIYAAADADRPLHLMAQIFRPPRARVQSPAPRDGARGR